MFRSRAISMSELEAVARAAVLAGGEELRRRYHDDDTAAEFGSFDVKAEADRAAESHMVPVVRQSFPDHTIYAEEGGEHVGSAPYRWIIDPLDGTNNFAAGLPTFASSVAVLTDGEPELAAVYLPVSDELYMARRNDGVRYRGRSVSTKRTMALDETTVGLIAGRDVPRQAGRLDKFDEIVSSVSARVKRVITSWAPTIHSGLFARGRIQGLIEFHPDVEEEAVTSLFTTESGGALYSDGPLRIAAADEELLDELESATSGT